jgi:integrase
VKEPKTRRGRRIIALPAVAVDALRARWKEQVELRLALGLGGVQQPMIFCSPCRTDRPGIQITLAGAGAARPVTSGLPRVGLQALWHSHASALIAAGVDPLTISRRLGHGTPAFTLSVYGQIYAKTDAAAAAIDAALGAKKR